MRCDHRRVLKRKIPKKTNSIFGIDVGLHALKAFQRIVKDQSRGFKRDRAVRFDLRLSPATFHVPFNLCGEGQNYLATLRTESQ